MALKEVYKFKNGEEKVEMKECHPRKLPLTSKHIAPYWFQALNNVFCYSKRRDLREVHKLASDDRVLRGLKLYRNKHIKENTVTKVQGGDVHAIVLSQDRKKEYTVVVKNYLPEHLPQYVHEREEYLANLFVDCACKDFSMAKYRDNASIFCIHISAVIWFLIEKFDMPKIFIMPEEQILGWKKSDAIDIATRIKALPLVRYTRFLNIMLLKKFRGMNTAFAISIHTIDNKTNNEPNKPVYLTYTETEDAEKICEGMIKAYHQMLQDHGMPEKQIMRKLDKIINRRRWPWLKR